MLPKNELGIKGLKRRQLVADGFSDKGERKRKVEIKFGTGAGGEWEAETILS